MNLNELIAELEALPNPDRHIYLHVYNKDGSHQEFGVDDWSSYRGFYDHVALERCGPEYSARVLTVRDMITFLRAIPGQPMIGWKGGDFIASGNKPLWIAESGDCTNIQPLFLQYYLREGVTDVFIVCAETKTY